MTDERIMQEHEEAIAAGTELEGYRPVRGRVSKNLRVNFAIRLSPEEMQLFDTAAKARGMTLADFFRSSARAAAEGNLDVDRASVIGAVQEKVRELNDIVAMYQGLDVLKVAQERAEVGNTVLATAAKQAAMVDKVVRKQIRVAATAESVLRTAAGPVHTRKRPLR